MWIYIYDIYEEDNIKFYLLNYNKIYVISSVFLLIFINYVNSVLNKKFQYAIYYFIPYKGVKILQDLFV